MRYFYPILLSRTDTNISPSCPVMFAYGFVYLSYLDDIVRYSNTLQYFVDTLINSIYFSLACVRVLLLVCCKLFVGISVSIFFFFTAVVSNASFF